MHQTHLKHLIQHFNLGQQVQPPERVHGGLLHIMWRLDTDKGSYAIKQLSKDIYLKNERVIKNYELSFNAIFLITKKNNSILIY